MDKNTINNTYRRTHCLKPNVYYELIDEIELKLADIRCIYYQKQTAAQDLKSQVMEPGDNDVASTVSTPDMHSSSTPNNAITGSAAAPTELAATVSQTKQESELDEYGGSTDNEFGKFIC